MERYTLSLNRVKTRYYQRILLTLIGANVDNFHLFMIGFIRKEFIQIFRELKDEYPKVNVLLVYTFLGLEKIQGHLLSMWKK
jgi:hypothetical protein